MKKLIILIVLALTANLTFNSCNNNIEPEEKKPSIRDYDWTIDTIDPGPNYRTYGFNIWGASPDDVWLVGSADTRLHTTWHYNGEIWYVVQLPGFVEGAGIWGFSNDNIWMGTSNSLIWHNDGRNWREFGQYMYKDYDRIVIQNIHGIDMNEVYAAGFADNFNGSGMTRILMKYDGTNWDFVEIPELAESFFQLKVDGVSGKVLLVSERFNSPNEYLHLYEYNNNELKEIDTSVKYYLTLGTIGDRVYITVDQKIYTYDNNELVLFKDFTGTEFKNRIWGRNESDFFTVNIGSKIGHYNGTDLVSVFEIDASLNRAVLFEKDIFIHAKEHFGIRDLVIHGVLK